jgi:hypothetical protein
MRTIFEAGDPRRFVTWGAKAHWRLGGDAQCRRAVGDYEVVAVLNQAYRGGETPRTREHVCGQSALEARQRAIDLGGRKSQV